MEVRFTTCQLETDYGRVVDKDSGKHFAMKWAYMNLDSVLELCDYWWVTPVKLYRLHHDGATNYYNKSSEIIFGFDAVRTLCKASPTSWIAPRSWNNFYIQ